MAPNFNDPGGDLPPGVPPDIAFRAAKKNLRNPGLRGEKPPSDGDGNGVAAALFIGLAIAGAVGFALLQRQASEPSLRDWDHIAVRSHCTRRIKSQLRDPDSYQLKGVTILSKDGPYGTARVYFRSKNGFGGYVNSSAVCESSPRDGKRWFTAVID